MIFNVSGGGGTALNFRVVGGTTAPTNPAENCIWVNTDTPITSWIFSATEPSPAEAGMVWITTGTSSTVEFNALKKNGIQVYPLSVKQYVGGAFVDKTAKSYQEGNWVDWFTYLLNGANTFDSITGGWEVRKHTDGYTIGSATFSNAGATLDTANGQAVSIMTKNKIRLSGIKKIVITVSNAQITLPDMFCLYFSTAPLANVNKTGNQAANFVLTQGENTIQIPGGLANGNYYVSIGFYVYNTGAQTATIKNVSLQ